MIPIRMSWDGKFQLILFWNPAASFWGWEFVPNKNASFMNLTPVTQEKCLKYLSSYHFDSFLSYVLWAPKKTRWWFQIYFFSYFHPYLGKWYILTSIFFRWAVQPPTRKNTSDRPTKAEPSARWLEKTPLKGGTSLGNFWPSWEGSDGIFGFFLLGDVFFWAAKELGSNNNISEKESKTYFCGSILGGVC